MFTDKDSNLIIEFHNGMLGIKLVYIVVRSKYITTYTAPYVQKTLQKPYENKQKHFGFGL